MSAQYHTNKRLRALLFCISLKHKEESKYSQYSLRALLFCISLKLHSERVRRGRCLRALLFCITLKPRHCDEMFFLSLRALFFCITPKQNKSPINWTICLGNLLFNAKTADNRLIGGVIEAPKGIFPFGAYSFLYVSLSVNNYFFRKAVTINK